MKRTPRRAESEIAALFSSHFSQLGMDPVQRIPILGRMGPDISINQMGMVVDVKSRKAVPASALLKPGELVAFGGSLLAVRLDELPKLWETQPDAELRPLSKLIHQWFTHMDHWTITNCPDGVSALALRRPGMPLVLGIGKRLFPEGKRITLKLIESSALPTGVVYQRFRPE